MEYVSITGVVEEIIYQNPDNGYTICDVHTDDNDLITATGAMPCVSEGEKIRLAGSWTTHPEYGEQLRVIEYEVVTPSDEVAILKYLSSGVIPGIREATARKLVAEFGDKTLEILLTQPDLVAKIKGISSKKAHEMSAAYAEMQSMQGIVMFLQKYNISAALAVKVHTFIGSDAVERIRNNPYLLADSIEGISFTTSDSIALDMGFPKNSPQRISSGIKYVLSEASYNNGHVYLPKQLLIEEVMYKLSVSEEEVQNALS
jgi:exodeoxyribonuclease V alpha subunit